MRNSLLVAAVLAFVPGLCRAHCPASAVVVRAQPYSIATIPSDNPLLNPVDSEQAVAERAVLGDGRGGVFVALESSKGGETTRDGCPASVYTSVLWIGRRQLQEWGFSGYQPVFVGVVPQIPGHPILGLVPAGRPEADAITEKSMVLRILVSLSKAYARVDVERAKALSESVAR